MPWINGICRARVGQSTPCSTARSQCCQQQNRNTCDDGQTASASRTQWLWDQDWAPTMPACSQQCRKSSISHGDRRRRRPRCGAAVAVAKQRQKARCRIATCPPDRSSHRPARTTASSGHENSRLKQRNGLAAVKRPTHGRIAHGPR